MTPSAVAEGARVAAVRSGTCLCGRVRVAVRGEPLRVGICHCATCRKESGSVFTYYGVWPAGAFESHGRTSEYDGQRFCPNCAVRLFSRDEREVEIKLGILDIAPADMTPGYELWVKRREPWLRPVEGAEQHDEGWP